MYHPLYTAIHANASVQNLLCYKEGLIKSARASCEEILRRILAQNFREMPQTHLISASIILIIRENKVKSNEMLL